MDERILAEYKVGNIHNKVVASKHAFERMEQRNIDAFLIISTLTSIGGEKMKELQTSNEDAMVIDEKNNLGIVFAINNNTVTIITVINKKNIFVKEDTELIEL